MIDVRLEIPIEPKGMQRATPINIGGRARMLTPSSTRKWQAQVALLAAAQFSGGLITEPVRVDILAILPRPKRLERRSDPSTLIAAPVKPDRDNIEKNLFDALKTFWSDDVLVVAGETIKAYAEKGRRPRLIVRIRSAQADVEGLAIALGLLDERSGLVLLGDARG